MTTDIGKPDHSSSAPTLNKPARDALRLLRVVFTVAPLLFGLDKFTEWLTNWEVYLAPQVDDFVPGTAHDAMLVVGVVEIAAGVLVALLPRVGGYVVAVWLVGIIGNLLLIGDYYDIALRDFGLLVAAVALARLASATSSKPSPHTERPTRPSPSARSIR